MRSASVSIGQILPHQNHYNPRLLRTTILLIMDALLQYIDIEKIMTEYLAITGQHRHLIAIKYFECRLVIDIATLHDNLILVDKRSELIFHRFT